MLTVSNEAEELARRLAVKIGKTPEDVITDAVRARARMLGLTDESPTDKNAMPLKSRRKPSFERMMEISGRFAHHPVLDDRTPDEIIGYDEFGVPQ